MSDCHFIDLRLFLSLFAFSSPKSFLFTWVFRRVMRMLLTFSNSDISPSESPIFSSMHTRICSGVRLLSEGLLSKKIKKCLSNSRGHQSLVADAGAGPDDRRGNAPVSGGYSRSSTHSRHFQDGTLSERKENGHPDFDARHQRGGLHRRLCLRPRATGPIISCAK